MASNVWVVTNSPHIEDLIFPEFAMQSEEIKAIVIKYFDQYFYTDVEHVEIEWQDGDDRLGKIHVLGEEEFPCTFYVHRLERASWPNTEKKVMKAEAALEARKAERDKLHAQIINDEQKVVWTKYD